MDELKKELEKTNKLLYLMLEELKEIKKEMKNGLHTDGYDKFG
jgi:hypothetical protein